MKCKYCGETIPNPAPDQMYCSVECGAKYRKEHPEEAQRAWPSIEFDCACCGRHVVTEEGTSDRRTRFCSHSCEKKYWRHPPHEQKGYFQNIMRAQAIPRR